MTRTFRDLLLFSGIFFLGVPALIVIHECAHFATAEALGYDARLSFADVRYQIGQEQHYGEHGFLITLAGPLANLLLAVCGIAGLLVLKVRRNSGFFRCLLVGGFSLLVTGCGRLLNILLSKKSDESFLAEHYGTGGVVLVWGMAGLSLVLLVSLFVYHRKNATLRPLLAAWVVGIVSMTLWLNWVGPALLPKKGEESDYVKLSVCRGELREVKITDGRFFESGYE